MTAAPGTSGDDLFDEAPCGYVVTDPDGTIQRVNRTLSDWLGRGDLVGGRFQDLLSGGGRIYHETHYSPLLRATGRVREIALDMVRADGTRLPALLTSVVRPAAGGSPGEIRTMVFDATDRRRYEQELLEARRREQTAARELQKSMLAGDLPVSDSLDIGVSYRPAVSGLEIGGDWYDAFWLDEGVTAGLVVGDVVGKGLGAAAVMGQLRSAVRALSIASDSPADLLGRLDAFARRHRIGRMTTLVYAELSLDTRRLRYSCAGHPPPAVMGDGGGGFLWDGRSVPLDSGLGNARERTEGEVTLQPNDLVVLYTDGVVESRTADIDAGMARLLEEIDRLRALPARKIAAALTRALRAEANADDVCALVARLD